MICDKCKKQTRALYIITPHPSIKKHIMPFLYCGNCATAMKKDGWIDDKEIVWDNRDKNESVFEIPKPITVDTKNIIVIRDQY